MEPINELLPKEAIGKEYLGFAENVLKELTAFGTHILATDIKESRKDEHELAPILLFRNFLELLDSTSILIGKSSIDPAKIICRSMLENLLYLEFLFQKDTLRRSMSFLVWHTNQNINSHKKFHSKFEEARKYREKIAKDKMLGDFQFEDLDLSEKISEMEALLRTEKYLETAVEYDTLKNRLSKKGRLPNWYELFNGPSSIYRIADQLNRQAFYEELYRSYSGSVHGTNIINGKIAFNSNGKIDFFQLRFIRDIQEVTSVILNISRVLFGIYIDNRKPDFQKKYEDWTRENLNDFNKITKNERWFEIN